MLGTRQVGKQAPGLARTENKFKKTVIIPGKQESKGKGNPRRDRQSSCQSPASLVFKAAHYQADFIKNPSEVHFSGEGGGGNRFVTLAKTYT